MEQMRGDEVAQALAGVPGWAVEEDTLVRTFKFTDFVEAMRFVNGAAALAEELGHHPDIDIRYNVVKVALTTHDAGGLTEMDFKIAERLSVL